jgi:hypothetical protein
MLTTILAIALLVPSFGQMPVETGSFKKSELVDLKQVDPTLWIDVRSTPSRAPSCSATRRALSLEQT